MFIMAMDDMRDLLTNISSALKKVSVKRYEPTTKALKRNITQKETRCTPEQTSDHTKVNL